jgi:hypothetical protein
VKLFLRTFANCEDQGAAQEIGSRIALALSRFSPEASVQPKRYWKLPHLFEFTFQLTPATEASFQEIASASSGGWEHSHSGNELSSVWNRKHDLAFLVPEVSWAEIQLYEEAA